MDKGTQLDDEQELTATVMHFRMEGMISPESLLRLGVAIGVMNLYCITLIM